MTHPLRGLKVLEMEGLAPTVLAGQILADLGAEVTIVSRPDPPTLGQDLDASVLNRGKKSIVINMKTEIELFKVMLSQTDVFIDSLRPGAMENLGVGPNEALKLNPKLVYARISSFGQKSSLSKVAGHDINFLSYSGVLSMCASTGNDPSQEQPPAIPANIVGDFAAGSALGVVGILAALQEVQKTGKGQIVDLGMAQASLYLSQFIISHKQHNTWNNPRGQNLLDGGAHFYNVYKCKDGKYISVGCIEAKFYEVWVTKLKQNGVDAQFCQTLLEEQLNFERWVEFKLQMQKIHLTKTRDEWMKIFHGSDACVSPVLEPEELKRQANRHLGYPTRPLVISTGADQMAFHVTPQPVLSNMAFLLSSPPKRGQHNHLKPKL